MDENIKYDYWWAGMKRMVPGHVKKVAEAAGSTRRLFEADKDELVTIDGISEKYAEEIIGQRKRWDIDREYDDFLKRGIDREGQVLVQYAPMNRAVAIRISIIIDGCGSAGGAVA